jgi:hypothetical protein
MQVMIADGGPMAGCGVESSGTNDFSALLIEQQMQPVVTRIMLNFIVGNYYQAKHFIASRDEMQSESFSF